MNKPHGFRTGAGAGFCLCTPFRAGLAFAMRHVSH
jgi:hypothetical protein